MKGIILAGGSGTRLHPITNGLSKQLLPVYSKPMIYYPLASLISAGVREILIITTPHDQKNFQTLLGDGSWAGISITYAIQPTPDGLAQAFIIGEKFIDGDTSALVLGDNMFYGHGLSDTFSNASKRVSGGTVFAYQVHDPERYGVVSFDSSGKASEIVEKPTNPKSNYAVTGIYFYDQNASKYAKELKPSPRGELEITDLNKVYLERGELQVEILDRGTAWLDTGTFDSLLQAANFVQSIEQRQGLMVCCPEEVAYEKGFINKDQLRERAKLFAKSAYGQYLLKLCH